MATSQLKRTKSKAATKASKMPKTLKFNDLGIHGFDRGIGILSHLKVQPSSKFSTKGDGIDGEFHIFGSKISNAVKLEHEIFSKVIEAWQQTYLDNRANESFFLQTKRAPAWILRAKNGVNIISAAAKKNLPKQHYGLTDVSLYSHMRDRVGAQWHSLKDAQGVTHLGIYFHGCSNEEILGALVGLEISCYRFQQLTKAKADHKASKLTPIFKVTAYGATDSLLLQARSIGESVNLARHLVNLDAAKLNPATYAEFAVKWFKGCKGVIVDVWGPERLLKEKMNLIYGVGQGAVHQSHMVHIKYRPVKSRFKNPVAFVGKGVTFDTGGLDIKPPSGMRLMKKDMGGSGSVMGLAHWLVESKSDVPCDLYLALAENSVDQHSFRPGDVITARNGLTVEIHNTDAEGRLVMADVLDVATSKTGPEAPCAVIDMSTLTGAMRVAVGTEIAGMLANHDGLADLALAAGARMGDPAWRLPLWDNYKTQLRSSFADLANASDSGFGGAISAALFLQKFVRNETPWLHFDLFCWSDRAQGPFADVGGNGQGIQMLVDVLERITSRTFS